MSECDLESSAMRRPRPTRAFGPRKENGVFKKGDFRLALRTKVHTRERNDFLKARGFYKNEIIKTQRMPYYNFLNLFANDMLFLSFL